MADITFDIPLENHIRDEAFSFFWGRFNSRNFQRSIEDRDWHSGGFVQGNPPNLRCLS